MFPDIFGGEAIFLFLVLGFSEARLFICKSPKALGIRKRGRGHRFADSVDLCLIKRRNLLESTKRGFYRVSSFLLCSQILVRHNKLLRGSVNDTTVFSTYFPASTFPWPSRQRPNLIASRRLAALFRQGCNQFSRLWE